jgi:hypothetical protein
MGIKSYVIALSDVLRRIMPQVATVEDITRAIRVNKLKPERLRRESASNNDVDTALDTINTGRGWRVWHNTRKKLGISHKNRTPEAVDMININQPEPVRIKWDVPAEQYAVTQGRFRRADPAEPIDLSSGLAPVYNVKKKLRGEGYKTGKFYTDNLWRRGAKGGE